MSKFKSSEKYTVKLFVSGKSLSEENRFAKTLRDAATIGGGMLERARSQKPIVHVVRNSAVLRGERVPVRWVVRDGECQPVGFASATAGTGDLFADLPAKPPEKSIAPQAAPECAGGEENADKN